MQQRKTSLLERALIALPWASIPLLAAHLFFIWDRLPARMASHFDLHGRPNGWQSPGTFALWAFISLGIMLTALTFATLRAFQLRSMWRMLTVISYVSVGSFLALFWRSFDRGAYGPSAPMWPAPAIFPLVALLLALAGCSSITADDPKPSPNASLIAEEQHRSFLQLLFTIPGLAVGTWLAIEGRSLSRVLGIFLVAVMAWVGIAVLGGFRYLVRSDGVQIKGFLMPLRFIPRTSIHSYRTQPWTGLGYGIRLTSTGTAYIWSGRNVVNIATDSGDVMLGHEHPERLIQDLDRMMQTAR
jgi:hypothetical protein